MQVQTSDVPELVAFVAHVEIQFEVPFCNIDLTRLLAGLNSESDSVPSVQNFLN